MRTRAGAQEGHRHLDVVAADQVLIPLLRSLLLALWCRSSNVRGPNTCSAFAADSLREYFVPTRLSLSTWCTDCRTRSFSLFRQHGPSRAVASGSADAAGHERARKYRQACDAALDPIRAKTHVSILKHCEAILKNVSILLFSLQRAHDWARAHTLRRSAPGAPRPPAHAD